MSERIPVCWRTVGVVAILVCVVIAATPRVRGADALCPSRSAATGRHALALTIQKLACLKHKLTELLVLRREIVTVRVDFEGIRSTQFEPQQSATAVFHRFALEVRPL